LNLVERWFRELTDKAIRHGVFSRRSDAGKTETLLRLAAVKPF
jgi:hypothetical protein